jgi:hypothetical protein
MTKKVHPLFWSIFCLRLDALLADMRITVLWNMTPCASAVITNDFQECAFSYFKVKGRQIFFPYTLVPIYKKGRKQSSLFHSIYNFRSCYICRQHTLFLLFLALIMYRFFIFSSFKYFLFLFTLVQVSVHLNTHGMYCR